MRTEVRIIRHMRSERITVSFEPQVAAHVRRCGAGRRGGASGYLAELVRRDALREAAEQLAVWYAANPTFAEDAVAETAAALDEAS